MSRAVILSRLGRDGKRHGGGLLPVSGLAYNGCSIGPMRYLILSDIHANLAALEEALAQVDGHYDRFVCLGDIVGYGPDPNEVTERVRKLKPVAVVRGNHDKAGCGLTNAEDFNPIARTAAEWTREQLTARNLQYLQELPQGPLSVDTFQIVHGSVRDEDEYVFMAREARESLLLAAVPLTFCGHTHFQGGFMQRGDDHIEVVRLNLPAGTASGTFPLEEGAKYLINPGSIGQPRDGDPRAGFAFYDDKKQAVEYWRVPYDIESTQKKMQRARLPEPLLQRLSLGR